jgi:serine/threonine protein kinase
MDEKMTAKIIQKLLLGVKNMHDNEIMHRDLKPDNILLRSEKDITSVVIADFGLATQVGLQKQMFKRCGTPGFVAPEVLAYKEGEKFYGDRCDIFSLGCIMHILYFY